MFRCRAFNGSFWHFVVHDPSAVDIVAHINAGDKFRPRNNLVGANLDKTDGASDVCWARPQLPGFPPSKDLAQPRLSNLEGQLGSPWHLGNLLHFLPLLDIIRRLRGLRPFQLDSVLLSGCGRHGQQVSESET